MNTKYTYTEYEYLSVHITHVYWSTIHVWKCSTQIGIRITHLEGLGLEGRIWDMSTVLKPVARTLKFVKGFKSTDNLQCFSIVWNSLVFSRLINSPFLFLICLPSFVRKSCKTPRGCFLKMLWLESTNKLLKLIIDFSKIVGYKIIMKKLNCICILVTRS
jgi:hypothetical protein